MTNTILPGDFVLVNKLAYGLRFTDGSSDISERKFKLSNFKRGDVLIFNLPVGDEKYHHSKTDSFFLDTGNQEEKVALASTETLDYLIAFPISKRKPLIKRLIGLPGEIIELKNGKVLINNKQLVEEKTVNVDLIPPDNLGLGEIKDSYFKNIFPHNKNVRWGKYRFGPIQVPGKGDTVFLDQFNLPIYEKIIVVFEKNVLEVKNGKICINSNCSNKYVFKQDYYFMLGDNRRFSYDSRMWGFLPNNHVIGRVEMVLLSEKKSGMRWKRSFKPI